MRPLPPSTASRAAGTAPGRSTSRGRRRPRSPGAADPRRRPPRGGRATVAAERHRPARAPPGRSARAHAAPAAGHPELQRVTPPWLDIVSMLVLRCSRRRPINHTGRRVPCSLDLTGLVVVVTGEPARHRPRARRPLPRGGRRVAALDLAFPQDAAAGRRQPGLRRHRSRRRCRPPSTQVRRAATARSTCWSTTPASTSRGRSPTSTRGAGTRIRRQRRRHVPDVAGRRSRDEGGAAAAASSTPPRSPRSCRASGSAAYAASKAAVVAVHPGARERARTVGHHRQRLRAGHDPDRDERLRRPCRTQAQARLLDTLSLRRWGSAGRRRRPALLPGQRRRAGTSPAPSSTSAAASSARRSRSRRTRPDGRGGSSRDGGRR